MRFSALLLCLLTAACAHKGELKSPREIAEQKSKAEVRKAKDEAKARKKSGASTDIPVKVNAYGTFNSSAEPVPEYTDSPQTTAQ